MKRFSGLELRKLSINTFAQFLVRLIGSFGTLLATLLIAYFLGYDSVGSFTKVTAFIASFYLLVDFGMNSVFLKIHFKDIDRQMGNLILLRISISLLLLPLVFLITSILPQNELLGTGFSDIERAAIIVYSLTLISFGIYNSLQAYYQHKLAYRLTIIPSIFSFLTMIGIIFYAVQHSNFFLLFTAYIFSGTVYSIFGYLFIKHTFRLSLTSRSFFKFSKNLLHSSWPLGIVLFFNFMYARTDIFILSLYQQNTDVGIYGISYRFFDVAIALPTYLANSTYPLLL
ncbi:MAG: oligosaccharide flippase family protein, partial [Candidatus Levybacteria bacterium]|nr:oligosaccharide flippase family protein [Candidatus Levybacteria bacterium]